MKTPLLKSLGILLLLAAFGVSLFRCTPKQSAATTPQKLLVKEPFEKVKIPVQTFSVSAETGGEIKLENGTRITVPPMAFIDKNGKPVTGEVQLKYREFHTAVDIMLSGIPMKFTDSGKEYDFESAGMFEINGFSGGEEVMIDNNKALSVQMASFKAGDNYNHYYFDQEKGSWEVLETEVKPEPNVTQEQATASAAEIQPVIEKPVEPVKFNPNATVLNVNMDYNKFPYLKEFSGLLWQYAGNEKDDPKNNKEMMKQKWQNVNFELTDPATSKFTLTFKSGNKSYKLPVVPALKGKNYEKAFAQYQQKFQQYQNQQALAQFSYAGSTQQAQLLRSFQVNNFGIYNCDRYIGTEDLFVAKWQKEFENGFDGSNLTIYHISKTEGNLIQYWPGKTDFRFAQDAENVLVAVLPDDKIAVADASEFEKIKAQRLTSGDNFTFSFRTLDKTFSKVEDLEKLVKEL